MPLKAALEGTPKVVAGAGYAVKVDAPADRRGRITHCGRARHGIAAVESGRVPVSAGVGKRGARAAAAAGQRPVGNQAAGGAAEVPVQIAGRRPVSWIVLCAEGRERQPARS